MRPTYHRSAFKRRVMLGNRIRLFVLVEGKVHDPVFYDSVCAASPALRSAGYLVWLAENLKDDVTGLTCGGRPGLLATYRAAKRDGWLSITTSSGPKNLAICMDRDCDGLLRKGLRNRHVIYTPLHDVEALIYGCARSDQALRNCFSLTEAEASQLERSLGNWRERLAVSWKPYIELCYFAAAVGSRVGISFKRSSTVHTPASRFGTADPKLVADSLNQVLSAATRLNAPSRILWVRAQIEARYRRGEGCTLLKGKWLAEYLIYEVRRIWGTGPLYLPTLDAVTASFLQAVDYKHPLAGVIRQRLEALV